MKLPAYPKYMPSGVEWLGEVPVHWVVKRLRYLSHFAYGDSLATEEREEGEVHVFGSNGPVGNHVVANTRRPVIVVGRKGSHGKVNFSASEVFAIDTTYFIDDRFTSSDLRWLFYLLGTLGLDAVSKDSAVPGLAREDAYDHSVAVPGITEQRAIADFLDRETAKIDTLVAKKRELIERLKEQRAALISRTVTRGLPPYAARAAGIDPNPRLKASGIEWLGGVPEHWGVTRLKHASSRIVDCPHETPTYTPGAEYFVIRTADISLGRLDLSGAYRVDEDEYLRRVRRLRLEEGDIVYGREGERWGFAASVPKQPTTCLGQRMMQFRAGADFNARFLMWHINAGCVYQQGAVDTLGATSPHVNVETIRNYWITQPPIDQQRAIADFIDRETAKMDLMTTKVESAIERLNEYRTAVITAAVTGKIDVRGVAA